MKDSAKGGKKKKRHRRKERKERRRDAKTKGGTGRTITQDERNGNENNEEHKYKMQRDGKKIIIKKQVKEKMKR